MGCPVDKLVDTYGTPMIRFTVEGPPVGFVSSGSRNWTGRQTKAWEYARSVRAALLQFLMTTEDSVSGVEIESSEEKATLRADKLHPLFIGTVAYFRNGVHPDPENTHKLVKDALFHKVPGGDKWTGGVYEKPHYDKLHPRVEVCVWVQETA